MKGEISNLSFFHKYYMANNNEIPVDFIKTDSSKLSDVQKEYPGAIIHVHDQNKDDLYIGDCKMTDNFNVGEISDDANTISVGGLKASTLGELKNKSMSQIIMDIVCPLTYPTVTKNPSINISYTGKTQILIKVGDPLPSKTDIKVTTDRGSFKGGMPYAGELVNVTLDMNPDNWGGTSTETVYTITGTGEFADGEIPKDSHSNPYPSGQYKRRTVTTNQITITSVYPIYINTDDITVMKEMPLVDYNTGDTIYVEIPPEDDGALDKFRVNLPSTFSKFTVKQYNSASGKYDIDINMVELENNQYIRRTTDKKDTKTGSAKYEIKLKK